MGKMERIFQPLKFTYGQIHIAGGFTTVPSAAKSKVVEGEGNKQHTFIKMSGREHWLVSSVCGPGTEAKGIVISRAQLLELLRDRICRKADGIDDLEDAKEVATMVDDYDPMNEIGSNATTSTLGHSTLLHSDAQGRKRYYKNRAKNCIVTVNIASRPPQIDPDCKQMRPVKLFIVDRKTIWLALNDVEWAVKYMYDQQHLKGVPLVAPDDAGPGGPATGSVAQSP